MIYLFECESCKKQCDYDLPVEKRNLKRFCESCGGVLIKVITKPTIQYKGRGWASVELKLDNDEKKYNEIMDEPVDHEEIKVGKAMIAERKKTKEAQKAAAGKDKIGVERKNRNIGMVQ